MKKIIKLICPTCNNEFDKELKEYTRQCKKYGNDYIFYCSKSCYGTNEGYKKVAGKFDNYKFIKEYDHLDKYSPFRTHLKRVRARCKSKQRDYDIDLQYLYDLQNTQNGICPYTKVKLILENTTNDPNYTASLDRIDSTKGYIKGNIQFISVSMNFLKNKYNKDTIINFFNIIKSI